MSGMAGMGRRGFTLIELVVVIGIIALLVSITVVVGSSVMAKGRENKTRDAIRAMDISLTEYIADRSNIPPTAIIEPSTHRNANDLRLMPVADAVFDTRYQSPDALDPTPRLINSVGLYILQLEESPGALAQIQSLSGKFLQLRPAYSPKSDSDINNSEANIGENGDHAGIPTVVDGWGRPLRYVHPQFDGQIGAAADARRKGSVGKGYPVTQILMSNTEDELAVFRLRRNKIVKSEYSDISKSQRDADGGNCPSDRPYFYSAGEDGDPSTIEDNVYSTEPVFTTPDFDNG